MITLKWNYKQPNQKHHLSYDMINQPVEEIEQPPYPITPVEVWKAYEQLKKAKVRGDNYVDKYRIQETRSKRIFQEPSPSSDPY